MEIPDLSKEEGLTFLNHYLQDKSFIEGFNPSKADTLVLDKIKSCPSEKFENLYRWYKQISSFDSAEKKQLPNCDIELKFSEQQDKKPEVDLSRNRFVDR